MLYSSMDPFRVADILSPSQVVLNAGHNFEIALGDELILYSQSNKKIIDPVTGINLGFLEIYRGTGYVVSVQENICILQAMATGAEKHIKEFLSENGDPIFHNISIGDFAKPNATKI